MQYFPAQNECACTLLYIYIICIDIVAILPDIKVAPIQASSLSMDGDRYWITSLASLAPMVLQRISCVYPSVTRHTITLSAGYKVNTLCHIISICIHSAECCQKLFCLVKIHIYQVCFTSVILVSFPSCGPLPCVRGPPFFVRVESLT